LKNDAHFSDFESGLKPLWLRAQSGDDLAYREALRLIAGRLRAYFRRHLMNLPDDVEDLVQETLLALHLHRGSYDPSHAVTAWVLGISRHKLVDLYRRRGRREALHDPIDELEDFLAAEESGEMLANVDLRSLLDELPQAQRVAIEMTKLEGLTVAQASARTGVSESAIKVQVHRGLKRLAVLVRKEPT
jgi:RNA polymerase sigma-70 factor (ECF subfamily)